MKQNLSMPPYVVQILDLRLFQSKAASGTFVLIKFLQGTSLSQEMNWIVNWILGKQTESANIQILKIQSFQKLEVTNTPKIDLKSLFK